jgi:putative MATE family efflux protein
VTSAVARALGSRRTGRANAIVWHALIIATAMSVIFIVSLALMPDRIFAILASDEDVLAGAVRYAEIAFGGATITWLFYVLAAILRGAGDIGTPTRAIIVSSLAQIVLSGVLTLGFGPIPSIGIIGPAVALVICQGFATLYLAWQFLRLRTDVRIIPQSLRGHLFTDIMQVGGLGLINSLTMAGTVIAVTGLVSRYGTEALAGYGVCARLELMLVPITFGIGGVLTAAVGINFGARQYARARRIAWTGAALTFLITGAIGLTIALKPGLWLANFTTDPEAYQIGALYLAIAAPVYALFGGGQSLYFASQGTGSMALPVSVSVFRFLMIVVVSVVALPFGWHISFVFAAVSVGLVIIGIGQALCLFGPGWWPDRTKP